MAHSWQTIFFSVSLTGEDSKKKEALDYFDMYFRNLQIDEEDLSATFDGTEDDFIGIVPHNYLLSGENYDICSHDIYELAIKLAEDLFADHINVSFTISGSIVGFYYDCQDFTITYQNSKVSENASIWYKEIDCRDYEDYEDFCDSYEDLLTEEEFAEAYDFDSYIYIIDDKIADPPGETLIAEKTIGEYDDD